MAGYDELFVKCANKQKENNENNSNKNFVKQYDEIGYCGLQNGIPLIGRFFGVPLNAPDNEKTQFDPVTTRIAEIYDDEGKRRIVKFPRKDEGYILDKIFNLITKHEKIKNGDEETVKYYYKNSHTHLFNRVMENMIAGSRPYGGQYPKSWYPRFYVIINFLDRTDDWCDVNKKFKIFTDSMNISQSKTTGDDIVYYGKGMSWNLYNQLLEYFADHNVGFNSYDVAIKKFKVMQNNRTTYNYFISNPIEYQAKYPDLVKNVIKDTIDPKFEEYEKNDLQKLYRPTSYSKIRKMLGNFINEVDLNLNTKFMEEVEYRAEEERKLYAKDDTIVSVPTNNQTVQNTTNTNNQDEFNQFGNFSSSTNNVNEFNPSQNTGNPPNNIPKFDISLYYNSYPFLKEISPENISQIVGFDINTKSFVYSPSSQVIGCGSCKKSIPVSYSKCPYCGRSNMDDDIPF
jgi:hypothetical protein